MGMQLGQHLVTKQVQTQKLILAPRMIQSMEILQLPLMALQERIEQELQENPLLDIQERDPDLPDESHEREDSDAPTADERELVVDDSPDKQDDFDRLMNLSEEWDEHFDGASRPSSNRVQEEMDRKHDAMANMTTRPQSLQDYLRDQLAWYDLAPQIRVMAERIIYNLDANGYLTGSLEGILDPDHTDEDLLLAQQTLKLIQQLDPPGVGGRDLRECLLLQLTPDMPYFEVLQTLIAGHLEDIRDNRLPVIQRRTGFPVETIQAAIAELRRLKPKPGAEFSDETVPGITPDVFVDHVNGKYQVRLEDNQMPALYISPYYRKLFQSGRADDQAKEWIKKKINSAQWLIESIEQRQSTLTKVAQAIVDHQQEFLDKGPDFIHPLKMQQIADQVGVHVTTVSRAVDKKWIQTPRGIFPLKRFFGGGTVSESGEEVAWDAVRRKLQEIIDAEDKSTPFSDDDLVGEMSKHGLTVARRTITKYRKAMNIPSSRQRRDWALAKSKKDKPKLDDEPAPEHLTNGHHDEHAELNGHLAEEPAIETSPVQ